MVRKRPSLSIPTKPDVLPAQSPYPFPFGWRFATETRPDGTEMCVQMPLTLDDVLHPREGDQISQNTQQSRDGRYLASVLERRLASNPHALVLFDCLVNWGVEGLGNHSPDVGVFEGVADPKRRRGSFTIAEEKARTVLVVEIVSPNDDYRQSRDNDVVTKVREYYRAGVPLYVIVDQEKEDGPRQLVGYQRGPQKFVPLPLDREGRLLLEPLRLQVALRDERVVCFDADTGEEIGDPTATAQALEAAKARAAADSQALAAAEERAAEDARARQAAEERAAEDAKARQAAEEHAAEDAKARQAAEERAAADARARQAAEERAAADAKARQAAEGRATAAEDALAAAQARIRELESHAHQAQAKDPTT